MLEKVRKFRALFSKQEFKNIVFVLIISILMSIFQAISILSIFPFINLIIDPDSYSNSQYLNFLYTFFNFSNTSDFIIFVGLLTLGFVILSNGISAYATKVKLEFVWQNNFLLSKKLIYGYISQPYYFFLDKNSSDLSKNILTEVNQLTIGYILPVINLIVGLFLSLGILILLILINPYITLLGSLFLFASYYLVTSYYRGVLKNIGIMRFELNIARFRLVNEIFSGIKEIKFLGKEIHYIDIYDNATKKNSKIIAKNYLIAEMPRFILEGIIFGSMIILILFLFITSTDIYDIIPLISIFAFAAYRLTPSLQQIYQSYTLIRFNQATFDNIYAELEKTKKENEIVSFDLTKQKKILFNNKIELKNISFSYSELGKKILNNINLTIDKNKSIAIVGKTGAGKTTIADIFLGLLFPTQGKITVDGMEIARKDIRDWQKNLGYVPQRIYISDASVKQNIAFGVPENQIDLNAVETAARIANIHDFIENELQDGYNTILGERGIRLSGGQSQRIGIARALYYNPDILVLDEATSSLDGFTEKLFVDAIKNLSSQKTLLIIAHRINTIKNCDKIVVLNEGKIVAEGIYEELIINCKDFQNIANIDT
jgi:ATP-binding cassette, subfamily B, bacterial PglK